MNPHLISLLVLAVIFLVSLVATKIARLPIFPLAMAVLAADRPIEEREGKVFVYDVYRAMKIYRGAIVCRNATGYAAKGAATAAYITLGISDEYVDNSDGDDGDLTVRVREGVFKLENSGSDPIAITELGQACYVEDDQTVAKTSAGGTLPVCGEVRGIDTDGVWVELKNTFSLAGDLIAANNLSDLANKATARTNLQLGTMAQVNSPAPIANGGTASATAAAARAALGANKVVLSLRATDLVAANAKLYGIVSPVAGTITKIYSVLKGDALAAGDATLTPKIGGTAITDGVVTITQAGSAIGDKDNATPSALNVVAAGDEIQFLVGGGNTEADAFAEISLIIET